MRNVHRIICFIFILSAVLLVTSCSNTTNVSKEDQESFTNKVQEMPPENETIASLSPNGKYRAEAFGTITQITAAGLFPYKYIRIIDVNTEDVIWSTEPGGYAVSFTWSNDSEYVGIYYTGRIWGESIVIDINKKKAIPLPSLAEIASHYDNSVKPQENRPDPYLHISGWKSPDMVLVDFKWTKIDGEKFSGQYSFNIKTNTAYYK